MCRFVSADSGQLLSSQRRAIRTSRARLRSARRRRRGEQLRRPLAAGWARGAAVTLLWRGLVVLVTLVLVGGCRSTSTDVFGQDCPGGTVRSTGLSGVSFEGPLCWWGAPTIISEGTVVCATTVFQPDLSIAFRNFGVETIVLDRLILGSGALPKPELVRASIARVHPRMLTVRDPHDVPPTARKRLQGFTIPPGRSRFSEPAPTLLLELRAPQVDGHAVTSRSTSVVILYHVGDEHYALAIASANTLKVYRKTGTTGSCAGSWASTVRGTHWAASGWSVGSSVHQVRG